SQGDINALSNINIHSNLFVNSNIYVNSNLFVQSFIEVQSNIYGNNELYINKSISANDNISSLYGYISSGSDIYAENDIITINGSIISASNITSILGSIISSNDIYVNSNIITSNGSIISGLDIYSQRDIITSNGIIKSGNDIIATSNIIGYSNLIISSNISILEGGLISKSNIQTLNGDLISDLNIIGKSNLIITSNIITTTGIIRCASNIYGLDFYGSGSNLSNILMSNVIGYGLVQFGGTGRSNLNSKGVLIGNGTNSLIVTSNLLWEDSKQQLIFLNSTLIISNIAPIIKIPFINNSHFSETVTVTNGGTGTNSFVNNSIPYYSITTNTITSSSKLLWLNDSNSLYVNGNIYGNGSNISNLNPLNIIETVPVIKGGTGLSNIDTGNLLIGNGLSNIILTSNLNWNNETNTLNVSNLNIINNLFINGSNTSNIDANKIINVISLKNGGLGISNISPNEFIFGFNENRVSSTSNVLWNENLKTIVINTNLFSSNINCSNYVGNGFNISNLDIAKIGGVMPISKGGLGFSSITKNSFIYASDNNKLSETSNIKWLNESKSFQVNGDIDI
ncbi:MAG: hypothetical protein EB038_06510, partial [Cyclobacteriaceae bacterium]|nr:hypothetical protein [Cyclobacteriaceae bacterium]